MSENLIGEKVSLTSLNNSFKNFRCLGEQRKKTKEFREMRWDPVNKRRGSFGETQTQKFATKLF